MTKSFKTPGDFRAWLAKNQDMEEGLWVRLYKAGSGVKSITYAEALDEALCYGWIDGRKDGFDEKSWLQKFTPRRARSMWSKINTGHAERLIKEKRMRARGLAQIEAAKKDGRWSAAYDSGKQSKIPEDFLKALVKNKKAKKFFETLNKTNLYSITWRLQTAKKPETRKQRIDLIVKMLEEQRKFH